MVNPKGNGGFIALYSMHTFDKWPHNTRVPVTHPLDLKKSGSFLLSIKTQTNTFTISSHVLNADWGLSRACEIIVWKAGLQIGWVWRSLICQLLLWDWQGCQKKWRVKHFQIKQDRERNKYILTKIKTKQKHPQRREEESREGKRGKMFQLLHQLIDQSLLPSKFSSVTVATAVW